jgi:type IV secretion system protein VirB10
LTDDPADDRGVSPIAAARRIFKTQARQKAALLGGGGVVVAAMLGMAWHTGAPKPPREKADTGSSVIAQVMPSPPVPPPLIPTQPAERVVILHDPPPLVAPAVLPAEAPAPIDYVHEPADSGEAVFNGVPASVADHGGAPRNAGGQGGGGGGGGDHNATTVAFKGEAIAGLRAGAALHMDYVMRPQLIPCLLDTAMDSTLAGFIVCHTTQPVLSDAHIVLMPAGTTITGSYKSDVKTGQDRLFAFAGSALTPEGIPVPLDSSIADGLGRAGISGDYDAHWGERFGAAVMLAVGEGALQIGQAAVSKGGNPTFNLNSGSSVSNLASQALQSSINIPPTISVAPGTEINIVVSQPIDFSAALKVTTR